ncbi:MAG: hypothetical protein GXP38_03790 [Chloroflexi bacterium]|nr:hypothetical protein [Chloroflexota bacterium]
MKLTFEIIFKSDYHIGAGYGLPPEVDSALHRDADGAPVMRGTIVAGLLRQGLYDLLQLPPMQTHRHCKASGLEGEGVPEYCGQWGDEKDLCPICALFGTPRNPKSWRISSARPKEIPRLLTRSARWQAGKTAAHVTTRARINPRTRRAEHNKLFSREEGNGCLIFRFEAETQRHDRNAMDQAAWLTAAARMVRRLGAGRRRGLGECEIQLVSEEDDYSQEQLLEHFSAVLRGEERQPPVDEKPTWSDVSLPEKLEQHDYRVRILIRLDEPLLLAHRAEAGNQFETVTVLPGVVLRGALGWRIAERLGTALKDTAVYEIFLDLFFRDAVRFSYLYPVVPDARNWALGYLQVPVPLDLRTCELFPGYKEMREHGVWRLTQSQSVPEACPECAQTKGGYESRLEAIAGFITLNSVQPTIGPEPSRSVEMHIRMDGRTGRVRSGDLFGYVALEPGQYFVGEITCSSEAVWQILLQMAGLDEHAGDISLRLGKATRRGYGAVTLNWQTDKDPLWHGKPIEERVTSKEGVVMTLFSDAVVLDDWGRSVRGFQSDWIAQELGLSSDQVTVDEERAFSSVRPIASFDANLGLPRHRDWALAAGSTVRLSFRNINLKALQAKLARTEQRGIGLRREEGLGLVTFNHPIHLDPTEWKFDSLDLSAFTLATSGGAMQALNDFRETWREHLEERFKANLYGYAPFEAAARMMQTTPGSQATALQSRLERVGIQTEIIDEKLAGRDDEPLADSEKGRLGMRALFQLLNDLQQTIDEYIDMGADTQQLWKIGLEMLAERVAAPVRDKQEPRR